MPQVYREKSKQVARRRAHNCSHAHSFVVREAVHQYYIQTSPNTTVMKKRLQKKKGILIYVVAGASTKTMVSA